MSRPKKQHPGSPKDYKGRWRIWWNGVWHDLGAAGSVEARAEYSRLVSLWAVDPNAPRLNADDLLISTLCCDYLACDESPQNDRSRFAARKAVGYLLADHPITTVEEFGPVDFRAWMKMICGLKRDDSDERRYCESTIKKLIRAIRHIWRWGVSTGRVRVELLQALDTVPFPKRSEMRPSVIREAVSLSDVTKTIEHLRGQVRAIVLLQLHTGARPEEILKLRPCELIRKGVVRIPGAGEFDCSAGKVWVVIPKDHKTTHHGKMRLLAFGKTAQTILKPFLTNRDEGEYLFSPREAIAELQAEQRQERLDDRDGGSGGSRKPIKGTFGTRYRARYSKDSYRQAIERACVKAGVPIWTPYQLRHLAAEQIDELYGAQAVQEFLGHSDAKTTERYRKQRAAVKRVAEIARER